jgi:signal transduction histidine kinase
MFPFVALISYAIYRHHLFNIKVAATGSLGFLVTVFSLVNVVYSQSLSAIIVNVVAFSIILFGSIQIIRAMIDLERSNARQESLLHFVSHEVKSYLTKGMYAFASLKEGDFGPVSPELKQMSSDAFIEMEEGVSTVIDIMSAANLRKGVMSFYKNPFDLKSSIEQVIRQQQPAAEKKHLTLNFVVGEGSFTMNGDEEKISRHVLRNLVDNAIKYTQTGEIRIELTHIDDTIRLSIKDHGIGITPEDMTKLFTEGGKGKDSTKINVHSTGYGLFVAKTVTDAHGGKISAESDGPGTGAQFTVEFPIT